MASAAKDTRTRSADRANSTGPADPSVEDVTAQLETLRADVARLVETVGGLGRAKSSEAARAVGDTAQELRDRGAESLAAVRQRGESAVDTAADLVRHRPAETLVAAAGLGFVVGLLASRR